MMNLIKQATSYIAPTSSPLEVLGDSLAIGGGSFAAIRLLQEVMSAAKGKEEPQNNALNIDLPKSMMPSYAHGLPHNQSTKPAPVPHIPKEAGEDINKMLAIGGGIPLGFMGAKTIYDKYKQYQLQQELDLANKHYMQAKQDYSNPDIHATQLGQIPQHPQNPQNKTAAATPAVDALCEKLAEELTKTAGLQEGLHGMLGDITGNPDPRHAAVVDSMNSLWKREGINMIPEALSKGTLGISDLAGKTMMLGAGTIGLGTLGAMAMANKKRQEAEQKRRFPESVQISYA